MNRDRFVAAVRELVGTQILRDDLEKVLRMVQNLAERLYDIHLDLERFREADLRRELAELRGHFPDSLVEREKVFQALDDLQTEVRELSTETARLRARLEPDTFLALRSALLQWTSEHTDAKPVLRFPTPGTGRFLDPASKLYVPVNDDGALLFDALLEGLPKGVPLTFMALEFVLQSTPHNVTVERLG